MAGTYSPQPFWTFFNNAGAPLASGLVFTYEAGTTTKVSTYTNQALTSANANPIVLDSAGRATIFLTPGVSYKFTVSATGDTDPPTAAIATRDNITAVPESAANVEQTGTAGEALTARDCVYLSDGSGGLTAGRWYKADSDNTYSSTLAGRIGFVVDDIASAATGAIRIDGEVSGFAGLTIGAPYYISTTAGAITSSAPAVASRRVVGVASSAAKLLLVTVNAANFTVSPLPAISGTSLTGVDKYLDSEIATVGNVGAGEDILATFSLTAGQLATNGESIKGIYWGQSANNANVKEIQVRIIEGANNTSILDTSLTVSQAGHWLLGFVVTRTGATTFRAAAQLVVGPTNAQTTKSVGKVTSSSTATWANAVEVRVTGEATANDDITMEGGLLVLTAVAV